MRYVVRQRADGRRARRRRRGLPHHERRGIEAGEQPGRRRLHVSLDSRNLPREQHVRIPAQLQRLRQQRRRVDVSVPMNLTVANELGVFEPRNQPENASLLTESQMILESDQVVAIGAQILLT